jgi:hypothetical protein
MSSTLAPGLSPGTGGASCLCSMIVSTSPLLELRPRVAHCIVSNSDHHAYLLLLELAGVSPLPGIEARANCSLYWKLNSGVLSGLALSPAFKAGWAPVVGDRPSKPAAAAGWRDSVTALHHQFLSMLLPHAGGQTPAESSLLYESL